MSCECACHRLGSALIEADCRCRRTPLGLCLVREPHLGAQNDYAMFYESFERMLTETEHITDRLTGDG